MKMKTMQLGQLGTNCYILWDENTKNAAIVDPGGDGAYLVRWLQEQELHLQMVLLTHGHFDHVGGVHPLYLQTGCRVYLNDKDQVLPDELTDGPLFWTDTYHEGDTVQLDSLRFHVLETPGHTPGSVCLLLEDRLFSGDTLFAGSMGRTDFPGGSDTEMFASLRRLHDLPEDYHVYPGHGESTTLAQERAANPYMRIAVRQ